MINGDLFKLVDLPNDNDDKLWVYHTDLGRITVLDRMTGYGYGVRDVESGFKAPDGKFWLASGDFDIREQGCKTVEEAIECIKRNANNMRGE